VWLHTSIPYVLPGIVYILFPFCPPHILVREKLPNYILGLAMSRFLKWCKLLLMNQWWSGDPSTHTSDSSLKYWLRKGNSQEFTQKFEEKSLQFIQKRQILHGKTLIYATRKDGLHMRCIFLKMNLTKGAYTCSFFLEVFTDSVTVDVFLRNLHITTVFFLWRVCRFVLIFSCGGLDNLFLFWRAASWLVDFLQICFDVKSHN